MKILMQIQTDSPLNVHEVLSMALALAAFDHTIQLVIGDNMLAILLAQPQGKLGNMLASLSLYDLPPAWVSQKNMATLQAWQAAQSTTPAWLEQLQLMPTKIENVVSNQLPLDNLTLDADFDCVLTL